MSNIVFPACDPCTTLVAPMTADQLTFQVQSVTGWPDLTLPENAGKMFLIGIKRRFDGLFEYMWVTATAGSTWTVTRNPSGCGANMSFARNDIIFTPVSEPLALILACFQQIEV